MTVETVVETTKENIKIIRLNKPRKKNAIDLDMYVRVTKLLNDAATDDNISIVVLTGTGDFYSSGNDLVKRTDSKNDALAKALREFIHAFIAFPKILIAIVNGPAIGIAVTTLPLCDFVFASENAYFYTPFTKLNIVAEGCSTLTFPKLMGDRKAKEMLLLGRKMFAKEALDCGLVNYIYNDDDLQNKAWEKITEIANLSMESVFTTKKLMRQVDMDELIKTNMREMDEVERITYSKSKL